MRFSHLVEINDPLNPLIDPLSREQVWRGLVLRVEMPKRFVPWLDGCEVSKREDETLERVLHYGDTAIRDQVRFYALQSVHVHVPRQGDITVADLVMSIEEPGPGRLFVRFEYDDHAGDEAGEAEVMVNQFRRSAYQESDIDTIRTIREMAADGLLDSPMM
jgi:hypothetical protein